MNDKLKNIGIWLFIYPFTLAYGFYLIWWYEKDFRNRWNKGELTEEEIEAINK